MSAWSEAVWIVQQMKKQFQANGVIQQYEQNLNQLSENLNNIKNNIDSLEEQANNNTQIFTPIVSTTYPSSIQDGMVWFQVHEVETESNNEDLPIEESDNEEIINGL